MVLVRHYNSDDCSGELLVENHYSGKDLNHFSIFLIESLAELLSINPEKKCMNIEEHINVDALDEAFRNHKKFPQCVCVDFPFGGYTVTMCTCGCVKIYGDKDAHENGEIDLPHSMNPSLGIEDADDECRM